MTGLIINVKELYISSVPIVEGFIVPQGIYRHPIGSLHCTSFIAKQLEHINSCQASSTASQESGPGSRIKKQFTADFPGPNLTFYSNKEQARDQDFLVNASIENVFEVLFCPELFDLPEKTSLVRGVLGALSNIHSDLKRKVLSVRKQLIRDKYWWYKYSLQGLILLRGLIGVVSIIKFRLPS